MRNILSLSSSYLKLNGTNIPKRSLKKIHKVVSKVSYTTYYYYDQWQVLAEYNGAGVFQSLYVYGNYIDEVLMTDDGANDYYYTHDHLYSSAALIEDDGDVIERYEGACPERSRRNAYDNVHIMDGNYNSRSSTLYDNPYTFTGRRVGYPLKDAVYQKDQYFNAIYPPKVQ